ncbi:MAG TPA: rhodanese-like domain-containing protein [Ignavibacteriaceae bacterium]|nr:rhodanese-like domain-containing protein [Ignavibacteriaceae bacterium]
MSIGQIILYVIAALVLISYVRKFVNNKKIRHYDPEEIIKRMKMNNVILLDVRTIPERKKNHIQSSIHIPLNQLRSRQEELSKYKNKEIVCYCRSGNRSLNAAAFLQKQGFNAANLKGGITAWNYRSQRQY